MNKDMTMIRNINQLDHNGNIFVDNVFLGVVCSLVWETTVVGRSLSAFIYLMAMHTDLLIFYPYEVWALDCLFQADATARCSDITVTSIIEMDPCTCENGVGNKPFWLQQVSPRFAWAASLNSREVWLLVRPPLRHDDVIKWKHFPRNWPFVRGIHRSPVNSPHKGQWRRALMILWSASE